MQTKSWTQFVFFSVYRHHAPIFKLWDLSNSWLQYAGCVFCPWNLSLALVMYSQLICQTLADCLLYILTQPL